MFTDVEARDRIATYARNLGDFIQNGKPTATFRHDIPAFLSGVHKALMQYGFDMGVKHGKGFRRNVRFDDAMHTFCIDMCLPGTTKWITVTYDQAIRERMERVKEQEANNGNAISSRPSSVTSMEETESQSFQTPASGSASTTRGASTSSWSGPSTTQAEQQRQQQHWGHRGQK